MSSVGDISFVTWSCSLTHCYLVANHNLELNSGMVFAVPIPKDDAADAQSIQDAIQTAVAEARWVVKAMDMDVYLLGSFINSGLKTFMERMKHHFYWNESLSLPRDNHWLPVCILSLELWSWMYLLIIFVIQISRWSRIMLKSVPE